MVAWRASVAALIPLLGCTEVSPPEDPVNAPASEARLEVQAPAADAWIYAEQPELVVEGTAQGLRDLRLRVDNGPWHPLEARPGWALSLTVPHGVHTLEIQGEDADGHTHHAVRRVGLGWQTVLAPPAARDEAVVLRWDLAGLLGWWADGPSSPSPAAVELAPLLRAGLQAAAQTPGHPAQALAVTVDALAAARSPLTPALDQAQALGLPAARVMADLFETPVGGPVLDPADLGASMLAAHPAAAECCAADPGALLGGLTGWVDTLGPKGEHPGLLTGVDPRLFGPGFEVAVHGQVVSQIAAGLDASGRPVQAPLAEPEVALDVADPRAIEVRGVAQRPRVALTVSLPVGPRTGAPGAAADGTAEAHPAWQLPRWRLARQVIGLARAAWAQADRQRSYPLGNLDPGLSVAWAEGRIQAALSPALGGGAPSAWAWELVLEAAQDGLQGAREAQALRLELPAVDWPGGAADLEQRLRQGLVARADALRGTLAAQHRPGAPPLLLFDGLGLRFDEQAGVHRTEGPVRGPLKALPVRPGPAVRLVASGLSDPSFLEVQAVEGGVRVGVIPGALRW